MEQVNLHTIDPQHFVTYRNDLTRCFCQVRLESGERVLVSGAGGEIKLVKLAFGGMIPLRTIWTLSAAQLVQLFKPFIDSSYPLPHPLDMTAMTVAAFPSIAALKMLLAADRRRESRWLPPQQNGNAAWMSRDSSGRRSTHPALLPSNLSPFLNVSDPVV